MSMSQYATYADYQASKSPADKDATLTRIKAMAAEAEAEAQMKRDAKCWRKFAERNPNQSRWLSELWKNEQ